VRTAEDDDYTLGRRVDGPSTRALPRAHLALHPPLSAIEADVGEPGEHHERWRWSTGASPRPLRVGGELLVMVASDRISAFDVIMAEPIAEKGGPHGDDRFLVRGVADLAPMSLLATDPAAIVGSCPRQRPSRHGGGACWCACRDAASRVHRARLPGRPGVRRVRASGTSTDADARRAAAGERLPAIFTPSTKATEGHDMNIDFDAAQASSVRSWLAGPGPVLKLYELAAARCRRAGSSWRHQVRARPHRRRAHCLRRAGHPDSSRLCRR